MGIRIQIHRKNHDWKWFFSAFQTFFNTMRKIFFEIFWVNSNSPASRGHRWVMLNLFRWLAYNVAFRLRIIIQINRTSRLMVIPNSSSSSSPDGYSEDVSNYVSASSNGRWKKFIGIHLMVFDRLSKGRQDGGLGGGGGGVI